MILVRPRDLSIQFTDTGLLLRLPSRGIAVRAPTFSAELLHFFGQPKAVDEAARRYGAQGARLAEDLAQAGILVEPEQALETPLFFQNFATIDVHRRMLADAPRLDAYARAIAASVQPGMTVLDAGTGSGILATMAARAGAARVYAVDNSDVLELAQTVFQASGVQDRVVAIRGDFRTVELPESVDVIVTETFGALGVAEGGLADIEICARRNLKPGGRVLPRAMELFIAPMGSERLFEEAIGPFGIQHGANLRSLRPSALARGLTVDIPTDALLSQPQCFQRILLGHAPADPRPAPFAIAAAARCHGFATWFDLEFDDDVRLTTGPHGPATHWKQQFLPVEPWTIEPGNLHLEVDVRTASDDRRGIEVETRWSGGHRVGRGWHRLR